MSCWWPIHERLKLRQTLLVFRTSSASAVVDVFLGTLSSGSALCYRLGQCWRRSSSARLDAIFDPNGAAYVNNHAMRRRSRAWLRYFVRIGRGEADLGTCAHGAASAVCLTSPVRLWHACAYRALPFFSLREAPERLTHRRRLVTKRCRWPRYRETDCSCCLRAYAGLRARPASRAPAAFCPPCSY